MTQKSQGEYLYFREVSILKGVWEALSLRTRTQTHLRSSERSDDRKYVCVRRLGGA